MIIYLDIALLYFLVYASIAKQIGLHMVNLSYHECFYSHLQLLHSLGGSQALKEIL